MESEMGQEIMSTKCISEWLLQLHPAGDLLRNGGEDTSEPSP